MKAGYTIDKYSLIVTNLLKFFKIMILHHIQERGRRYSLKFILLVIKIIIHHESLFQDQID